MKYKVLEITEDDHGCEGLPDGEERMITLLLENSDGERRQLRMADRRAYELNINEGSVIEYGEV